MNVALRSSLRILAIFVIFASPLALADEQAAVSLKSVKTFMSQLTNLDKPGAVDRLAQSGYDMLIVEPTFNMKGSQNFDAQAMVKSLHDGKPGRIVLAYLNIGEAENSRIYWGTEWNGSAAKGPIRPGYLLGPDPDGDDDSFLVRYWRPRWQNIFLGKSGVLDKLMADGFDGVYLDRIDVYDDDTLDDAADRDKVLPATAMVNFISAIRQHIRKSKPDAVVVAQNAAYLLDDEPKILRAVDGVAFEDTWYAGRDDAGWNDADAGDIPNTAPDEDSTPSLVRQYHKYLRAGLPVFTIDYCVAAANAARVYRQSADDGFIPLVTRVSVENPTPTPPPNLPPPNLSAPQP
jgi:cysteinyl-tRNA synthetase, unknown class